MQNDPWVMFDEAVMETGDRKVELLEAVLRALETTDIGTPVDAVELAASVRCELAYSGAAPLVDAVAWVDQAEALGRAGWPNYHFAEAAVHLGEHRLALDRLQRIPVGFFEEHDLFWRALRCWELEAIANLRLGDWARANRTVEKVAVAYAVRAESDDLVDAPRDLVTALLLDLPEGVTGLATLAASLDITEWFDSVLVSKILTAVNPPDPTDE